MSTHSFDDRENFDGDPSDRFADLLEKPWNPSRGWILGVLLVAALLGLRFGSELVAETALLDEEVYLQAFEAVNEGRSPYDVEGYLYPPAFAHFGAAMSTSVIAPVGPDGLRYVLRALNFIGLLLLAVFTVRWTEAAGRAQDLKLWLVLALALTLSNGVAFALSCGNVSFLAAGTLFLGLSQATRRPWLAGILLAVSTSIKPFAAPTVGLLGVAGFKSGRRAWWQTSLIAVGLGALFNLPSPWLLNMTDAAPSPLTEIRSTSLHRIGALWGLHLDPLIWLALAGAFLACLAWKEAHRAGRIYALCVLGILAMPVVWNHTLLVLLPWVGASWAVASCLETGPWLRRSSLWVLLVGLSIVFFESGAVDRLASGLQGLLLSIPFFGAGFLTWLWWTKKTETELES